MTSAEVIKIQDVTKFVLCINTYVNLVRPVSHNMAKIVNTAVGRSVVPISDDMCLAVELMAHIAACWAVL